MDPNNVADIIAQLQAVGAGTVPPSPPVPPFHSGGGNGIPNDMEARVAKLEAHMEHVRSELGKLASLPADAATIKERLMHLPTKAEVKADIDVAIERAAGRTQRTIAIASGLVMIVGAAINLLPKLLGH